MNGTGDHAEWDKPNITCSCLFVEPSPKMMVMTVIIVGHECKWGTVWGVGGTEKGRDTERQRGPKQVPYRHMKTA
jgi:hypothetical protein